MCSSIWCVLRYKICSYLHVFFKKKQSDVFDFANDPSFVALLAGLHELSKKHLSQIVRTLMTWKTRQITEVEKLKSRLQKDTKSGISLKEGLVLLEERHQLCVDYTFLSTLQSIFKVVILFDEVPL